MRILPVLDIMNGHVVRGIGGIRENYRPLVSRLTTSTEPVAVAKALRDVFHCDEIYLADLDAIMGQAPALAAYRALQNEGFKLWVDAGIRGMMEAYVLREAEVATIVAGLETITGPEVIENLCQTFGSARIVFSLDLKGGQPLGKTAGWLSKNPMEIAEQVINLGVKRLLVLDLAKVGLGTGTSTEELCSQLSKVFPHVRLAAGGGIGTKKDIKKLNRYGVQTVLIASALHDGRITDFNEFSKP